MQESEFRQLFDAIPETEVAEEVEVLENIRLSTDFFEYVLTDPGRYLAIIHYTPGLEDKYKLHVTFSEETGNMTIVFMMADNVYCTSGTIDITNNDRIFDSFTEQVQQVLTEYKALMTRRENERLERLERRLQTEIDEALHWYDLYVIRQHPGGASGGAYRGTKKGRDGCCARLTRCAVSGICCGMFLAWLGSHGAAAGTAAL